MMNAPPPPLQLAIWAAAAVALVALVVALAPVLSPFLIAATLAYLLVGCVDRLMRLGVSRTWAVLLVELIFLCVVVALVALLIPVWVHELPLLRDQVPVLVQKMNTRLSPWLMAMGIHVNIDIDSVKMFVRDHLSDQWEVGAKNMLSSVKFGGSLFLTIVGHAILVPVALYYMLQVWPKILSQLHQLIPARWIPRVTNYLIECDQVLGRYVRGQLLVMLSLAIYYAVALDLGGLELAWPIGIFTGLLVCLPYVGVGIGLVLALLSALLQFEPIYGVLMVLGVFGLGQLLESFILTPRLIGQSIGLHPLLVIFALLAFAQLLGFVGVLLALPVSAVLLVAWRHLMLVWLTRN